MTETSLAEFERSIDGEESFWHDYNLEVSSDLLSRFSINDWAELKRAVFARPKYWQERCAEAVGYMENMIGLDLLISLLESPYMSVAAISASEINNMSVSLPKAFRNRLIEILGYLKQAGSSRYDDVEELIARLV